MKNKLGLAGSLLLAALALSTVPAHPAEARNQPQQQRRPVHIFLDLKETNLDKPSTVGTNTLAERIAAAGFRVTTNRREAALVVEGTMASRAAPVTDDVKREGGVNTDATASVRLLAAGDVIATSVERSAPGDWGVQAERVGEDRLIEVAGRIADDLFNGEFFQELIATSKPQAIGGGDASARPAVSSKPANRPARKPQPKRGVSFLEIVSLVQNYTPEERIVDALKKYGIKFRPKESAISQLRSLGASDALINAIKTSNVV
jgi:hypothetical protein